jgi:hypothetical protein
MTHDQFVKVHTVSNPALAEIIKNALENQEIPCFLDNQHQAGLAGVFDIQILVPTEYAEAAATLIAEHQRPADELDDVIDDE